MKGHFSAKKSVLRWFLMCRPALWGKNLIISIAYKDDRRYKLTGADAPEVYRKIDLVAFAEKHPYTNIIPRPKYVGKLLKRRRLRKKKVVYFLCHGKGRNLS